MLLLPPCQALSRLHALRSNIVARILKLSGKRQIQIPDILNLARQSTIKSNEPKRHSRISLKSYFLNEEEEEVSKDDEESEEEACI